jgi:hypothetical protein
MQKSAAPIFSIVKFNLRVGDEELVIKFHRLFFKKAIRIYTVTSIQGHWPNRSPIFYDRKWVCCGIVVLVDLVFLVDVHARVNIEGEGM